ncbi:MAG: Nre family DNA repair protein [Candidatus Aenigmarchaeota archaeon]|nr:Nre family DNA repair protein [Candidatus Aenigmarchaeota archaeon]
MPIKSNLCPACNSQLWRHRSSCPVLKRILLQKDFKPKIKQELFGSTPPSVLVGEWNYPKVNVGLLLPQEQGNTEIYDAPKEWFNKRYNIEDVFRLRLNLFNAKKSFLTTNALNPDKYLQEMQIVAASTASADAEVVFEKRPFFALHFDPHNAPFGPSGLAKKIEITGDVKIDRKIEYVISDVDLKAEQAIKNLYREGYDVYNITKMLSVGLLGAKIQRKLVPTRWAITAVDSIIIKSLLNEVKQYQEIDQYMLFETNYMGNYFEIILMPKKWMFEVIEIAVPGADWMLGRKKPIIARDYEFYEGRKDYASNVAGGYYAAEIAVLEFLANIKRQAGVIVLREIRPEYYAPVGVWKIRECLRDAFKQKPIIFNGLDEIIKRIDERFLIKSNFWKEKSVLLNFIKRQKTIDGFIK